MKADYALAWLGKNGSKAGRDGMARYNIPSDKAFGVPMNRIQALAKDDPDRKRKALRIYLESLLLQHLGTDLLRDASFVAMVDAVQQQMEQDREIAAAADRLAGILLAGELPKG